MEWLAAGLPLSLLMDLADADVPDSDEILHAESYDCDIDWLPRQVGAGRVLNGLSSH
jgi:hypothetical protein